MLLNKWRGTVQAWKIIIRGIAIVASGSSVEKNELSNKTISLINFP